MLHHLVEGRVHAGVGDDVVGKLPVVVKAAAVFVILDLRGGDLDTGEVRHGAGDGLAVGIGDVGEHAIHVEDQKRLAHFFQTSLRAASKRRVWARVPTVMRTQPGAS